MPNSTVCDRLKLALRDQLDVKVEGDSDDVLSRMLSAGRSADAASHPVAKLVEAPDHQLTVTFLSELEIETHGLLIDERLGTLALIWLCGNREKDVEEGIQQKIYDAIHVRQVLCDEVKRRTPHHPLTTYSVELVLVIEAEPPDKNVASETLPRITEQLREIMARSGFLHAIGVSVLHVDPAYDGGEDGYAIDPSELRRAFPWLLTDVRKWLREASPVGSETRTEAFELQSIELRDFRVAGSRKWDPTRSSKNARISKASERQRLHLIHGANGSGKSSFTEAIELALTDRIARLERSEHSSDKRPKYVDVLTNRQRRAKDRKSIAAEISLMVKNGDPDSGAIEMVCRVGNTNPELKSSVDVRDKPELATEYWERLRGTRKEQRFQNAGAFRLDQVFSDRIVDSSSADRAELFLNAFFPDGGERLEVQKRLRDEFEKAWNEVPVKARFELRKDGRNPSPEHAIEKLTDLVTDSTPASRFVRWSGLEGDLAGLVPDSLPALKAHWSADLGKQLAGKLSESRRDNLLTQLDDSFAATELDARSLQSAIEMALPLLRSLDQWEARSGAVDGTIEEFADCLNDWLEKHADWDLAEKSRQLVATKVRLTADGGNGDAEGLSQVADESDSESGETLQSRLDVLSESARRLDTQREEAHRRVLDFRLADDSGETSSTDRPHLSTSALEALDRVATTRDSDSFSAIVHRAVQSREPEDFLVNLSDSDLISAQIGRPGGLKPLIDSVERQLSDVQKLLKTLEKRKTAFAQIPLKLKRLRETAEACQQEGSQLIGELKRSLEGPLQHALNELLALMTPARWAYHDVISKSDFDKRSNEWNLSVQRPGNNRNGDETESDDDGNLGFALFLNTAELNSFALALFLLCAPKLDNPLRLLVLDDPFQNMDELTISTISRAIGRLMRLWQNVAGGLELWNLLVLVHGEGTMSRIRNEVACSAAYLPWLQPRELDARTDSEKSNDDAGAGQVEMEDSLLSRELDHPARQSLIEIVCATS